MGINLKEVFLEWNNDEIIRFEKLINLTNKSVLKRKYIKQYNKHLLAKDDMSLITDLVAEDMVKFFNNK